MTRNSGLAFDAQQSPVVPAGRRQRVGRIFRDNYRLVWRLLRRLGVNHDEVEDAVQQVFLIVAERLDDVRSTSERSFVYGTAIRVASNHRRRAAREALADSLDGHISPLPNPSELADHKRAREVLDLILSRMTEELRVAYVLFEIEGFTTPEIAELTGVPLGTAASRLRRARESFRRLIRKSVAEEKRGQR